MTMKEVYSNLRSNYIVQREKKGLYSLYERVNGKYTWVGYYTKEEIRKMLGSKID